MDMNKEDIEKLEDEIDAGLHDLNNKYEDGWDEEVPADIQNNE